MTDFTRWQQRRRVQAPSLRGGARQPAKYGLCPYPRSRQRRRDCRFENDKRSVFLDETPLANADGSLNFSGVTLDTRNGSQDQSHIPGFPAVENESPVSIELRSDQP